MHGGVGMTDEYDVGLYMKRVRVLNELMGDHGFHADRVARAGGTEGGFQTPDPKKQGANSANCPKSRPRAGKNRV